MGNAIRLMWEKLRDGYSKLTAFGIAVVVVSFIPDWQGRIDFWSKAIRWTVPHLASPIGRFLLVICGVVIIWLDHRRVLGRRGKPHPKSLPGRTLKLKDQISGFIEKFEPLPDPIVRSGESEVDRIIRRIQLRADRNHRLEHAYELRFSARVTAIYHEFGEIEEDQEMNGLIYTNRYKDHEYFDDVLKSLKRLAEKEESRQKNIKQLPVLSR